MAEYKDLTGFIFKRTDSSYQGGNGYWKIICLVEDNNNRYAAYSTIKCTKTGKEFDTTNRLVLNIL